MPQLGETVAEGKITRWFKAAGDRVAPGDNLFEIETDKTSMEVPATVSGVVAEIRTPAGAVVPVGAIVAVIADCNAAASSLGSPSHSPTAATPSPQAAAFDPFRAVRTPARNFGPARLSSGARATPLARRLASEAGIDLTDIAASGPHRRIHARDVRDAAVASAQPATEAAPPQSPAAKVKAIYEGRPYDEVPIDGMRRTIASRLIEAKQTVPHFYLTADVDLDHVKALRTDVNAGAAKDADGHPEYRLSLNDFLIKAMAVALRRVSTANAVWTGDSILRFSEVDIGVAVAVEGGLVTPVIRSADAKSVVAISAEMKDLAGRARARKLEPREYLGGATTVSNLGMYGVREFAAIINPPQSTILAIGAVGRRPVEARDGGFRFVSQATATLSCDHRVVDGAVGARLLAAFKHAIEHPIALML